LRTSSAALESPFSMARRAFLMAVRALLR
jgi:hypothetical protein